MAMTAADAVARALRDAGVRRMYGVPSGGSIVDLIEAGRRIGLRFVLAAQEGPAAMMAATEAELTGVPGVCLATLGPGAANASNGVAHAALDRAPILMITDRYPAVLPDTLTRQRVDHAGLYRGLAKGSFVVAAARAGATVGRALRLAQLPPRGPVHLDLPSDVTDKPSPAFRLTAAGPRPPAPIPRALQRARALLARARRPLILAGLGVGTDAAAKALVTLAERLGAPVLATYKAKGVIPDTHPLAAGPVAGGTFEDRLIGQADLLVAVGLDTVELFPRPWAYPQPVIDVSEDPASPRAFRPALQVVGDLAASATGLAEAAGRTPGDPEWGAAAARAFKAEARRRLAAASAQGRRGIAPHRAMEIARDVAPPDTVVTVDSGAHMFLASFFWDAPGPRAYLCSSGHATMGYALPGAVAAKLCAPRRPALAVIGDGGLLMVAGELATAAREKLPVVVLCVNDRALTLIKIKQAAKRYPAAGVDIAGVDYARLAESLGCRGFPAGDEDKLEAALREAFACGAPAVVDARVDPRGYAAVLKVLRG
jgi:acetolactate synthase-1/2/3 large subunit